MAVSLWLNSPNATKGYTFGSQQSWVEPFAIRGIREMVISYLHEATWYQYQLQDAGAHGDYDSIVYCIAKGANITIDTVNLAIRNEITDTRCYDILLSEDLLTEYSNSLISPNGPMKSLGKAGYCKAFTDWTLSKGNLTMDEASKAVETSIKTGQLKLLIGLLTRYPQLKDRVLYYIDLSITSGTWVTTHYLLSQVVPYVTKQDMIRGCGEYDSLETLNLCITGLSQPSYTDDLRYYFGVGPVKQNNKLGQCCSLTIFGICNSPCSVFYTTCNVHRTDEKAIDKTVDICVSKELGINMIFLLTAVNGFVFLTGTKVIYYVTPDRKSCQAYCKIDEHDRPQEFTPQDIALLQRLGRYQLDDTSSELCG